MLPEDNTAWHIGNSVPYRRRMMLHTYADTPDFQGFDYYFASEFNSTSDQNSTLNPTNLVFSTSTTS